MARKKNPKKPWNNDAPARVFVFLCLKIHREKRVEVMFCFTHLDRKDNFVTVYNHKRENV